MSTRRPIGVTIIAIAMLLAAPAIVPAIAGIGLWLMRRWGLALAWVLLFVLLFFGAVWAGFGLLISDASRGGVFASLGSAGVALGVPTFLVSAASLYYLTKRSALFT